MFKKLISLLESKNEKKVEPTLTAEAEKTEAPFNRSHFGQQKIGIPQKEFIDSFRESVEKNLGEDAKLYVLAYYMKGMLFSHLLSQIDNGLSDEDLQVIHPDEVKFINLILIRDFMRHNRDCINPSGSDGWIDEICTPFLSALNISDERKSAFPETFDLDDLSANWAKNLAAPFNIQPFKLAMLHSSIVTGPADEGLCD